MTIESLTGQTCFDDLGLVGPELTRTSFLESYSNRFESLSCHGEWTSYRGHVRENQGEFVLTVVFKRERLFEVRLARVQGPSSWAEWDEKKERQRKTEHDLILSTALGQSPGQFQWGEASSVFEARSGASEI